MWQIFAAIISSIFLSFLMTSKASLNLKYGLLGLGAFFAVVVYSGEIWSMVQPDRSPAWLTGMTTSEGVFYEWVAIHMAWIGGIAGMITGYVILKKRAAAKSIHTSQAPSEPDSRDSNGEREQG
jgi:membrane protein DedA with SNARE-associated domain